MNFQKIFTKSNPLILASQSPQRANILNMLKIPFEVIPSSFEEILPLNHEEMDPSEIAKDFAYNKALNIQKKYPDKIILGVDTLVVNAHGKIIGKPENEEDAKKMIINKSGNQERVISGIALLSPQKEIIKSEETIVQFAKISEEMIDEIISWNEWQNRSGSFSIEGKSTLFIKKIDGDFWNVVGLPSFLLGKMIEEIF